MRGLGDSHTRPAGMLSPGADSAGFVTPVTVFRDPATGELLPAGSTRSTFVGTTREIATDIRESATLLNVGIGVGGLVAGLLIAKFVVG